MKSDFNFQFFGIEVGTISDGLGMAQATPFIWYLNEFCSIVYFQISIFNLKCSGWSKLTILALFLVT